MCSLTPLLDGGPGVGGVEAEGLELGGREVAAAAARVARVMQRQAQARQQRQRQHQTHRRT